MRRFFIGLISATAAFSFSQIALAADLPVKALPAPPVAFSWTGFYIGGNLGGAFAKSNRITEPHSVGGPNFGSWDCPYCFTPFGAKGSVFGGLQVGYNYQVNSMIVLGLEGDVNAFSYSVSAPEQNASGVIQTGGDTIGSKKANWLATIRGRVGITPFDHVLIYATGGVAFSDLKYSVVDACNTGACGGGLTSGSTHVNTGWTIGGGVEYAINNQWSVKGEYLYAGFEGKTFNTISSTGYVSPWSADATNFQIIRAGLNYRF